MIDEAEWQHAYEQFRPVIGERATRTVMTALPRDEPATKADLDRVAERFDQGLGRLRSELRGGIAEQRGEIAELRGGIAELRGEMRGEMVRSTQSIIKWVAGIVFPTLVAGLGASAAITAAIVS